MSKPHGGGDAFAAELAALSSSEYKFDAPLHVLLGEAVDVARFFEARWASERDAKTHKVTRAGLETAGKKKLPPQTGQDILALREAAQKAQTAYLLAVHPAAESPMTRGHVVLDEVTGALEFLFDDGVQDEHDAQLASLGTAHHDDPDTPDALAGALDDYAALATPHRDELDGLGGFDVKHIDEARTLATALRALPAASNATSPEARDALARRNKLLTLLDRRVALVRGAARFVFRDQPEIVREVTSTYARRKRAAARRAKNAKVAAGAPPATPPATPPAR